MSKRANGGEPKRGRLTNGEAAPPLLSEKLIAQLQSAVGAAASRIAERSSRGGGGTGQQYAAQGQCETDELHG